MSWPHPLDFEWRLFTGAYFKVWYDIRFTNEDGVETILQYCWPNAGEIHTFLDAQHRFFKPGECEIRISKGHPFGNHLPQLTPLNIKHLITVYGEPEPAELKRIIATFGPLE